MSAPRLHLAQPLLAGGEVRLAGDRAHYLRTVLRLREGEPVLLFNAAAGEWRASLRAAGRHEALLLIEERTRAPRPEPGPTLVFAPIRRNRLDWLVEKATELGAAAMVPVITRRTVARPETSDRLQAIATEAAEQCERLSVPLLAEPQPLPAWLAARDPAVPLLFADEAGEGSPLAAAARRTGLEVELLVGPEGGFAPAERAALLAIPGVVPVSLGPLVLRAETAAIYAMACWRAAADRRGWDAAGPRMRAIRTASTGGDSR